MIATATAPEERIPVICVDPLGYLCIMDPLTQILGVDQRFFFYRPHVRSGSIADDTYSLQPPSQGSSIAARPVI